ncbi:SDR family oxidoreductase [Algoriphagus kandeliae]|uniref:SDR family oxidoreductase n=1 Tax=Algoriphagus kandeliae TaxID=2562278 RepID=A0A4Y9QT25_9BACT|nr:SDR family oxidoreductase [Algoriphagus kandeliae]TFV94303.1 SDR family oxidoreductase [Algoriphagus kandeliae]
MNLNLQNHIILISGGAKGIGAAISKTLIEEGAIPVIIDPSPEGQQLVELAHGKALHIPIRLTDEDDTENVIQQAIKKFGKIHGLVNNAGANDGISLENGTPKEFLNSLSKNLLHYYNLAHFALPYLKATKGSIVNISSKTAITGQGGTSGYVAAKGAQLALTREWAAELLPYHIRVNAVIPAEVMTPLYKNWLGTFPDPNSKLKEITDRIPLEKRMTRPEEIASMVVFLLSEKASHITGQHLFVDGGYTHLDRAL